jgi:hypothetical protein
MVVQKTEEINMAGRLGERLLSQQSELESRIRELEEDEVEAHNDTDATVAESDGEGSVDEEIKTKLDALESETRKWGRGNEEIYRLVNGGAEKTFLDVRNAVCFVLRRRANC